MKVGGPCCHKMMMSSSLSVRSMSDTSMIHLSGPANKRAGQRRWPPLMYVTCLHVPGGTRTL